MIHVRGGTGGCKGGGKGGSFLFVAIHVRGGTGGCKGGGKGGSFLFVAIHVRGGTGDGSSVVARLGMSCLGLSCKESIDVITNLWSYGIYALPYKGDKELNYNKNTSLVRIG